VTNDAATHHSPFAMNLICVMSDTLRYDFLGANGHPWIKTPSLDRFAGEAVVFERAFQASFPTIPTRTDLWTGRYTFPFHGWAPLRADVPTFATLLGAAGYTTMLIGDTPHLFSRDHHFHRGFTGWQWMRGQESDNVYTTPRQVEYGCDPCKLRADPGIPLCTNYLRNRSRWTVEEDWCCARTFRTAMQWLAENHSEGPFCLWLDTFDPHEAWDPPQHYVDLYDPGYEGEVVVSPDYNRADVLTPRELEHARARYAGEITMVDTWFGRLLATVDLLELRENTAILFMSDHGFYIGEHGLVGKHGIKPFHTWPFYDEVAHINLMWRIPGGAARRTPALVQPPDVTPTMLELAEIPAPETFHGRSLVPVLQGEIDTGREIAVTSSVLPVQSTGTPVHSTITDGEWVLIYGGEQAPAELYHRPSDPGQVRNRLPEAHSEAERLLARHVELLRDLGTDEGRIALRCSLPDMK
jgi:arylsulfatase A-like enzyme